MATPESIGASVLASDQAFALLADLHRQGLAEEQFVSEQNIDTATLARDKFVALDADKCAAVYLLLRAAQAKYVVEAGTSFGVSTIYLALAVGQNAKADGTTDAKVIATEHEPTKAAKAREHWRSLGKEVEPWIDLREGDLRETLKSNMPQVDFLLLDIWTPMALPALKLVEPYFRTGALIIADNTQMAANGYKKLIEYVSRPGSKYRRTTMPYNGGLELIVYLG